MDDVTESQDEDDFVVEHDDECESKPDTNTVQLLDQAIAKRISEWRNNGVHIEMMDNFDQSFAAGNFFGYIVNNNSTTVQLQQSKQLFSICNETVENNADTTNDVKKTKLTVTLEEFAFSSSSSSSISQSSIIDSIIKHPFFNQSSAIRRRDQHNLFSPLLSTCENKFKRKMPQLKLPTFDKKDSLPALDDGVFKKPMLLPIKYSVKASKLNDKASKVAAESIPKRQLATKAVVRLKRMPDDLFVEVSFGKISLDKLKRFKFADLPKGHRKVCNVSVGSKPSNTIGKENVSDNQTKSKPAAQSSGSILPVGPTNGERPSTMKSVIFSESTSKSIDGRGKIYPKTPTKPKIKSKSRSEAAAGNCGNNVKQLVGDFAKLQMKNASDNHSVDSGYVDRIKASKENPSKSIDQSAESCLSAISKKMEGNLKSGLDKNRKIDNLSGEFASSKSGTPTQTIPSEIMTHRATTEKPKATQKKRDNIKGMENPLNSARPINVQKKKNVALTNGKLPNLSSESNSRDKRQASGTKSNASSKTNALHSNSIETIPKENESDTGQHSPTAERLNKITKQLTDFEIRKVNRQMTSNLLPKPKTRKDGNVVGMCSVAAEHLGKFYFYEHYFPLD